MMNKRLGLVDVPTIHRSKNYLYTFLLLALIQFWGGPENVPALSPWSTNFVLDPEPKRQKTAAGRSRGWSWTVNNPLPGQRETIAGVLTKSAQYFVIGTETGASGTEHLQGTTYYKNPRTFKSVQKEMACKPHLESSRDVIASIEYCKKEGKLIQHGTPPTVNAGSLKLTL